MRTYWYNRVANFGDRLGPVIMERMGIPAEWAPPAQAEIVTAGSILSQLPPRWRGIVLGSGLIASSRGADLSRARVLAVRGALTRDRLGLHRGTLLADPGILAPFLMPTGAPEQPGIVVAPHYIDDELARRYPLARELDVTDHPLDVIAGLAGADLVITSSLHVAIAADALGILHVVEPHPKVVGGLFKFEDYASAFGLGIEPGIPRLTPRPQMEARQEELRDYYLSLVSNRRAIA